MVNTSALVLMCPYLEVSLTVTPLWKSFLHFNNWCAVCWPFLSLLWLQSMVSKNSDIGSWGWCLPVKIHNVLIGHCIGGGVMLALAHDYQVMRSDRGWFSIPIVKLKHTLPLGLLNLAKWVKRSQSEEYQSVLCVSDFKESMYTASIQINN